MRVFCRLSPFTSTKNTKKSFLAFCIMLFFWTLFEASVGYVTPLKIIQSGLSETALGILIGSSSIFGALFDFFLSTYLPNTHFRRIFLWMFLFCFLYPFLLWKGTVLFYLLAMVAWGLYYDLVNFGVFDFVGRKVLPSEHSKQFGLIEIFKALGYILAPIIISLTVEKTVSWQPFIAMLFFLSISFLFFLLLLKLIRNDPIEFMPTNPYKKFRVLTELSLWKRLGKILLPVLLLTFAYNALDSFFWTIGPLLGESLKALYPFNGLFLSFFSIPSLFVGWFIGSITKRFGKKRTAFFSFSSGALLLGSFAFIHNAFAILGVVFFVGIFINISLPAIEGAYADYISEAGSVEKEIEALIDFFINLGFIVGPITAGFLADTVGNAQAFSIIGIIAAVLSFSLIFITPKHITIKPTITA